MSMEVTNHVRPNNKTFAGYINNLAGSINDDNIRGGNGEGKDKRFRLHSKMRLPWISTDHDLLSGVQ